MDGLLAVAMVAGVYLLLPRLGGWAREAAALRHARLAFVVAAIVAQAVSLGCYAGLYRRVLASLERGRPSGWRSRLRWRPSWSATSRRLAR